MTRFKQSEREGEYYSKCKKIKTSKRPFTTKHTVLINFDNAFIKYVHSQYFLHYLLKTNYCKREMIVKALPAETSLKELISTVY